MNSVQHSVQVSSEFDRPPWAQRKFSFGHPPWMLADFGERLRGALPRLDALLVGLDDSRARLQLEGKWSIAQNIGHLSDVEELWQERLEDLKKGMETYAPAVASRFQELAKRHQERSVRRLFGNSRRAGLTSLRPSRKLHPNCSSPRPSMNDFKCRCVSSTAPSSTLNMMTIT